MRLTKKELRNRLSTLGVTGTSGLTVENLRALYQKAQQTLPPILKEEDAIRKATQAAFIILFTGINESCDDNIRERFMYSSFAIFLSTFKEKTLQEASEDIVTAMIKPLNDTYLLGYWQDEPKTKATKFTSRVDALINRYVNNFERFIADMRTVLEAEDNSQFQTKWRDRAMFTLFEPFRDLIAPEEARQLGIDDRFSPFISFTKSPVHAYEYAAALKGHKGTKPEYKNGMATHQIVGKVVSVILPIDDVINLGLDIADKHKKKEMKVKHRYLFEREITFYKPVPVTNSVIVNMDVPELLIENNYCPLMVAQYGFSKTVYHNYVQKLRENNKEESKMLKKVIKTRAPFIYGHLAPLLHELCPNRAKSVKKAKQ